MVSWADVRNHYRPIKPKAAKYVCKTKPFWSSIVALATDFWNAPNGDITVILSRGVMILTPANIMNEYMPFGGFAPKKIKPNEILHNMPLHRFDDKSAAAAALKDAQNHYKEYIDDHSDEKPHIDFALAGLNCVGYPMPGDSAADANVAALWYKRDDKSPDTTWLALVECACFYGCAGGVAVLTQLPNDVMPNNMAYMKQFADAGRDAFRLEFLHPRILGCFTHFAFETDNGSPKEATEARD